MPPYRIKAAEARDAEALAELMCALWPEHTTEDLAQEFLSLSEKGQVQYFLLLTETQAAGFAQCSLRHDYVEGTDSSPVGYLEGIYVRPALQRQGLGQALLHACEDWAREKGCREFASDCTFSNLQSLSFHLQSGFKEAGRIICFQKKLE